ncbi:uncharacterized protein TNCV_1807071 [Trichonephila clavipes]|nr:uncharacterized protein TNCV_1807071 [Trichonephila clavipes]
MEEGCLESLGPPRAIVPIKEEERNLNGGGLSVFEKEDFPITQYEFVCSGTVPQRDASLEAVNQQAPNNSKNWQWTTEDESHVNLWNQDDSIRVRRYAGERCLSECVIERHSDLTPGVMVWGGISYHGRSNLLRNEGNLNSNSYVREVLPP